MIFAFKKTVAPFFMPLPVILLMLVIGLLLMWLTRKEKTGWILVLLGVVLLYAVSTNLIPNAMIRPLENRYPPLSAHRAAADLPGNISYVVVLGGGHVLNPDLPLTSQIGQEALVCLVEGIGLCRRFPKTRLVLSGGAIDDPVSDAEMMAGVAGLLGVTPDKIILETRPQDTKDEARYIKQIVGEKPFVLVTSAEHMPRAMALFAKQGMRPVPAPTVYRCNTPRDRERFDSIPKSGNISTAEHAVYEYLGIIWAWLRGQIASPCRLM